VTDELKQKLTKRFHHFDADRAAPLFHKDQPGMASHDGKAYPAAMMANGVAWFYDRERRGEVKAGAPPNVNRGLLRDNLEGVATLYLVEGEGHAVAMRSVGVRGVVVAGGTQGLLSKGRAATDERAEVFGGRRVVVLFDPDTAGQTGAFKAGAAALKAGARGVWLLRRENLPEDWSPEMDVEDWLSTFDTRDAGAAGLHQLLLKAEESWLSSEKELKEASQDAPIQVLSETLHPKGRQELAPQVLLVAVRNEDGELKLAVWVAEEAESQGVGVSVRHDEPTTPRGAWHVVDQFEWDSISYMAGCGVDIPEAAIRGWMREDTKLSTPYVPAGHGITHAEVWDLVQAWFRENTGLDKWQVDVLTACCLLSWRVWDIPSFKSLPLIHLYGPPGSGKSLALSAIQQLFYRALLARGTSSNLHWIARDLGHGTHIMDEFQQDGDLGSKEGIHTLVQGCTRFGDTLRVQPHKGRNILTTFDLFGLRVVAGYEITGADQVGGYRRRVFRLPTRKKSATELPLEVRRNYGLEMDHERARHLRGLLLAWRGLELGRPMPSVLTHPALAQFEEAGIGGDSLQSIWPALCMVPEARPEAMASLLHAAKQWHLDQAVAEGEDAHVVLANAILDWIAAGKAPRCGSGWVVSLSELAAENEALGWRSGQNQGQLRAAATRLGLGKSTRRLVKGWHVTQLRGILLLEKDEAVARAFQELNLTWPPAGPEEVPEGCP
jgi:hypothetical protein